MAKSRRQPVTHSVEWRHDDNAYGATYYVKDGLVYVDSAYGSKATGAGHILPKDTARRLLGEMVLKYLESKG